MKTVNDYKIRPKTDFYRADLQGADLQGADLHQADLRGANLQEANLQEANLRRADLRGAKLRGAKLRGADLRQADLRGADLRGADLRGADLDFSCWPLWCGSLDVKIDAYLFDQLVYHLCAVDCSERSDVIDSLRDLANNSGVKKRHNLDPV